MPRFLIALLLSAFVPAVAAAQSPAAPYLGKPIASVHVVVEERPTTDPALIDLLETTVGEELTLADVRESMSHLYSLGRFQDIQVEAIDAAGGVALRYLLEPVHDVARVELKGTLGLSKGRLEDAIEERFGERPPVARAQEVATLLEQVYEDAGYYRAAVTPVPIELHDPDRTILTFEIDAGPRAMINTIDVRGDAQTSRADLLNRLDIRVGAPYERVKLQGKLSEYAQRLRRRRFYQATATHTYRLSDDETRVDVTVDVQSGPIVAIAFDGDPIERDRLRELVPIEREGSADEDLLEDWGRDIRDDLRQQGYWRAEVTHEGRTSGDTLTIVYSIRKGLLYRVAPEGIEVSGNRAVGIEELRPLFTLEPGDLYLHSLLDQTVVAIENLYRPRGFASVKVTSAANEVNPEAGEGRVRPAIVIEEGPRTTVSSVAIRGAQQVPEETLRPLISTRPDVPFYAPTTTADRDAILVEYLNRGFASATVAVVPQLSEDRTQVAVAFQIEEGPQTIVDHIIIVGNTRTDEQVIRRELLLRTGQPLGLQDLLGSRRRLAALGLFRRIEITELEHGSPSNRDIVVTVEESPATSIAYGGGLEISRRLRATSGTGGAEEQLELSPRGFFDIGRRNIGGRNRSVNLYTRLSLRQDSGEDANQFGFAEYRVVGTYREPRTFTWNADLNLTAAVEQGVRTTFNFARKGVTAELLRNLTPTLRGSVRYSFNTTRRFDEQLGDEVEVIDRIFDQVRLSLFSAAVARDTRDDVSDPSSGTFMSGEGSIAARSMGGQVGFLKSYLQTSYYTRMPAARRVVFAGRVAVGIADGFARTATNPDGSTEIIEDLPASERFFAGGDTTIRGFSLDTVGTPDTISARGFPKGGNAVVILNGELRIPVWRDFGTAIFADGGNVFDRVTSFDFGRLRGAFGFGLRYNSPVGPVRLDLGIKASRLERAGVREPRYVWHFSIGQAF